MFKIGDFSRLSQVSVKTLRYYADLGMFEPVHIDQFSGYRYFSIEQLPRLNRILALKDLGLSLEQISRLLAYDILVKKVEPRSITSWATSWVQIWRDHPPDCQGMRVRASVARSRAFWSMVTPSPRPVGTVMVLSGLRLKRSWVISSR